MCSQNIGQDLHRGPHPAALVQRLWSHAATHWLLVWLKYQKPRPCANQRWRNKACSLTSTAVAAAPSAWGINHLLALNALHCELAPASMSTRVTIANAGLQWCNGQRYWVVEFTNGWLQWHLNCIKHINHAPMVCKLLQNFPISCDTIQNTKVWATNGTSFADVLPMEWWWWPERSGHAPKQPGHLL